MEFGVSSFAFGWAVGVDGSMPARPMTAVDVVNFTHHHGLPLTQFGDHVPLHTFSETDLAALAATARDRQVKLEIGARGLTESHLADYLALARRLDARLVRFVIDRKEYQPSAHDVVALLRTALPEIAAANTTVGIENHDRFPARTLRQIMEQVDSERVGICLDTANSLGSGEGLEHVLAQLAPHTVNLHIKDYAIIRVSYAMGFVVEGRPAGQGRLQLDDVLEALRPHGRCRTAVLETWVPPEGNLEQTIAKERQWVEASLAYLKPRLS